MESYGHFFLVCRSVALATDIEVRSGHSRDNGSVLCLALERGGDRLLLSGGLDGRVCLYRLDMPRPPPPGNDLVRVRGDSSFVGGIRDGDTWTGERTVIRSLASSQRGGGAGGEGHGGAVSSVQW